MRYDVPGGAPEADTVRSLLAAIVESSQDAIVSKTLDGIITSWNRAAEQIFGYSAAEAVGRSIGFIIPPERRSEHALVLEKIRRGESVRNFETIRQDRGGRRLSIALTVSPIRDGRGAVIGASAIARRIDEKKLYEAERERLLARERAMRKELAQALRARDDFISVAAHEFRNPLNVFHLTLQLLHRIAADPARAAQAGLLLDKCELQLARLTSLVERLLDVSRASAGKFDLCHKPLDLNGILREIVARHLAEPGNPPIALEVQEPAEIRGDRVRIEQALGNLISNAIRYGESRPIAVATSVHATVVRASVRDHGIGISSRYLERIFDRFARVEAGSHNPGLGLGLWITKQIVEGHGGTIRVESEPGKGSLFVIDFPRIGKRGK